MESREECLTFNNIHDFNYYINSLVKEDNFGRKKNEINDLLTLKYFLTQQPELTEICIYKKHSSKDKRGIDAEFKIIYTEENRKIQITLVVDGEQEMRADEILKEKGRVFGISKIYTEKELKEKYGISHDDIAKENYFEITQLKNKKYYQQQIAFDYIKLVEDDCIRIIESFENKKCHRGDILLIGFNDSNTFECRIDFYDVLQRKLADYVQIGGLKKHLFNEIYLVCYSSKRVIQVK